MIPELTGIELITDERERQIDILEYTPEYDRTYVEGELRDAAIAYLMACDASAGEHAASIYPWDLASFKHTDDVIRNLARAGALIAAEIDRLQA